MENMLVNVLIVCGMALITALKLITSGSRSLSCVSRSNSRACSGFAPSSHALPVINILLEALQSMMTLAVAPAAEVHNCLFKQHVASLVMQVAFAHNSAPVINTLLEALQSMVTLGVAPAAAVHNCLSKNTLPHLGCKWPLRKT